MPEKRQTRCPCCSMPYTVNVRSSLHEDATGTVNQNRAYDHVCSECKGHQGSSPEQRLRKFEEDWPRLQYLKNQAGMYAASKELEIKDAKRQTARALQSREDMARRLKKVEAMHTMRPDGSCTCGLRKCRTSEVFFGDRWLQDRLARLPEPDLEHEELLRRPRESFERRERWMGFSGDGPSASRRNDTA